MIKLHSIVFLGLLQLLVVFVVLWLVWFFKNRSLARQLKEVRVDLVKTKSEVNPAVYFSNELIATQVQLEKLADDDAQALTALNLRSAYLDIERELAQGQRRDPEFWTRAEASIAALLAQHAAPAAEPVVGDAAQPEFKQTDEEETVRVRRLFDEQTETLNKLKAELAALAGGSEEGQLIMTQLEKVTLANREMSMCVSILEDDNTFLRDQITALLRSD